MEKEKPEVKDLMQLLKPLVRWERFAESLPGIKQDHIETCKVENGNIDGQKRALFNKWLAIYLGAEYSHVIKALETAEEHQLADDVRKWLATKTTR